MFIGGYDAEAQILWPLDGPWAQLYLTLCDRMDCRLPGSSVHGISQVRIPEWVDSLPSELSGKS